MSQSKDFQNEYEILRKLEHENIVNVYDIGISDKGEYYIVMEYLDGVNFDHYISKQTKINYDILLDIFICIAKALAYAHANNIIHCDIKPSNIIICKNNLIKITDFGLAEDIKKIKESKKVKGTISYMSPEQINAKSLDFRTDLFSFGVLMYESLSGGNFPYNVSTTQSLVNAYREGARPIINDFF